MSDWSSDVCSSDLFDPLIRDRKRTERLFGFHYRIEVFVPAPKRKYGYYVFPLLEGDRLIGRLDINHERDNSVFLVKGLWLDPGQPLPAPSSEFLLFVHLCFFSFFFRFFLFLFIKHLF